MASVSYDELFTCFLENCKINSDNLPKSDDGKYEMIHNACRHYMNKMEDEKISWSDETETISGNFDNDKLLILAYCMKLIYHENSLTDFTDVWVTFQKEIGIKNYKDQVDAREKNIARTEHKIDELITNIEEFSVMD